MNANGLWHNGYKWNIHIYPNKDMFKQEANMLTYDCIGGFEKNITIYVYMGISIHDNDNGEVKYR